MEKPYLSGYIEVGSIHKLYYSCWGSKKGKTVLLIHGGPGYGSNPQMLEGFDLEKWNLIMYDQRGCGHSLPLGEITENNTEYLIEDIKEVLDFLGYSKVVISGNSWGTTLAVAFAERYPHYVESMILSSFFNGENTGTLLGKNGGFEKQYPDLYYDYTSLLTESEKKDPYMAYYYKILKEDEDSEKYAKILVRIESLIEKTQTDYSYAEKICDSVDVCSVAKIEMYYTMNDFFLEPGVLIKHAGKLKRIRVSMVHGKLDAITPIKYAWVMAQSLPNCDLHVIEDCGHTIDSEEGKIIWAKIITEHLIS